MPLAQAITAELGGFAAFKEAFGKAGLGRFGSGWAWLIVGKDGKLAVTSTPNQDSPIMDGLTPAPGPRRLGARLLSQVPEPPARLHRRLVEHAQLGRDRPPLRGREEVDAGQKLADGSGVLRLTAPIEFAMMPPPWKDPASCRRLPFSRFRAIRITSNRLSIVLSGNGFVRRRNWSPLAVGTSQCSFSP